MAEQDQKQKQKPQKHSLVEEQHVPMISFERPKAHGWYTVVFPKVHDQNTVLELWQYKAQEWLTGRGFTKYFSCFAHGTEKKEMNRISPVYFFKEEMDAAAMMWRFNGELLK